MLSMELESSIYVALYNYTKALTSALGYRDCPTRLHSERVLGLSREIGVGCGLSAQELGLLSIAASFHDIGKIGIPDAILRKSLHLDAAEWEAMKQHSEIGERIMVATELEGSQQASLVVRFHHEYYNGNGYPDHLSGEDIPICSRIIGIADSYDAMAVTRVYQRARKHSDIMAIMQEETGGKHDPVVMRIFCKIIESSRFKAPVR
jgi:HD-GYP domain-containing protein (c-di-GMP phosphodiesterase class II)